MRSVDPAKAASRMPVRSAGSQAWVAREDRQQHVTVGRTAFRKVNDGQSTVDDVGAGDE
ncbi:hypothetical protein OHB12_05005 [Nocardia sp. NBC_01730]|uniref:hypothetical protein n=1 Tax=Nocardia sp. NBC_01730 TaxID=2975998 RepID=UPI002E12DADB|nr:hypothetical protein OHB12_05005 [Nocardia sp. NBC_01730]